MENYGLDLNGETNMDHHEMSKIEREKQPNDNEITPQSKSTQEKGSKGRGSDNSPETQLYYSIDDEPPWYLTFILGFQHYLTMVGATVTVPFILTPKLCMLEADPDKTQIISTIIFISGVVTLLQSTLGTRLPIIQGGSFSFIVPTLAILGLPEWKCPSIQVIEGLNQTARTELWETRIREVQGAIIVASLLEVFLGFFGIIGVILRFITPLTIAPAIMLIGIQLFKIAAGHAATNWYLAALTILLIIFFSQYIPNLKVPIPFTRSPKRAGPLRYPIFQVFPVLITIALVWLIAAFLTFTDLLPSDNQGRTDIKTEIIAKSAWFYFPYPFQWGWPTFTTGSIIGMMSGVIAGTIESIGDYYACARISGAGTPPTHAINRGIFLEGVGCVLAGIWGTGNGTTSYSENIGAINVTKVGSRRVIQAAGFLMLIFSLIGKFGAIFVSIPEPIIGGLFCVVFATVTGVGLSNLQGVNLNSPRTIFIIGFSIFFSLSLSQWADANSEKINTGIFELDTIIRILLQTGMFVAGFLGFVFDNTIPGTPEERGLHEWASHMHTNTEPSETLAINVGRDKSYDLPFGMGTVNRLKWLRKLPISPTFRANGDDVKLPSTQS